MNCTHTVHCFTLQFDRFSKIWTFLVGIPQADHPQSRTLRFTSRLVLNMRGGDTPNHKLYGDVPHFGFGFLTVHS